MFVAEALYSFSKAILEQQTKTDQQQEQLLFSKEENAADQDDKTDKRARQEEHDTELKRDGNDKDAQSNKQASNQIIYLSFEKGAKILVEQSYQNGWWFGNVIGNATQKGFFPSNYVKVGSKPPPPPPKSESSESGQQQKGQYDDEQDQLFQKLNELKEMQKGALTSDYYQGIKGFKYVKINDKNKNILNGSYVKFDVATGLARVPVKDQAPCSKAVRQMGYYFDFHQWNQERNRNPDANKSRPDPSKKKKKKLRLLGMGKDA